MGENTPCNVRCIYKSSHTVHSKGCKPFCQILLCTHTFYHRGGYVYEYSRVSVCVFLFYFLFAKHTSKRTRAEAKADAPLMITGGAAGMRHAYNNNNKALPQVVERTLSSFVYILVCVYVDFVPKARAHFLKAT